jgi:hypothetical protein
MHRTHARFAAAAFVAFAIAGAPVAAVQDNPTGAAGTDLSGLHDFDLRAGHWLVHHKRLKERLANSREWQEFDGTQDGRLMMGGFVNVDENFFDMPGGAAYSGVTMRSYDPKTGEWAIWWLDGRMPHNPLDPPVKGRFVDGVGTFYADDTLRGKPVRVRFVWSKITANGAHWEQAFSPDGGKTWETNWVTDFRRAP